MQKKKSLALVCKKSDKKTSKQAKEILSAQKKPSVGLLTAFMYPEARTGPYTTAMFSPVSLR